MLCFIYVLVLWFDSFQKDELSSRLTRQNSALVQGPPVPDLRMIIPTKFLCLIGSLEHLALMNNTVVGVFLCWRGRKTGVALPDRGFAEFSPCRFPKLMLYAVY